MHRRVAKVLREPEPVQVVLQPVVRLEAQAAQPVVLQAERPEVQQVVPQEALPVEQLEAQQVVQQREAPRQQAVQPQLAELLEL